MADALIIVESPAKARTISKFLGSEFSVESSIGHIRDLPSNAAEIPAKYKKKDWARLGVDVDGGFVPIYVIPASKRSQVAKLKKQLAGAEVVYLATDEDREGEAIAWHLVEVLRPKVPVRRMVFHEITRSAISRALEETREVDVNLVRAQEARRVLDRLVGYEVSPLLWRKIKPRLSAGRVQSVATRLVVERERARMRFTPAEFWSLEADLADSTGSVFSAKLSELDGAKIAVGKNFDPDTGRLKGKARVLDGETARRLASTLEGKELEVARVVSKPFTTRPYAPFMTSTLQQEAGRKLRFNAQKTMRVAQSLYENGYITYMRTDSVALSSEAISAARRQIAQLHGEKFLPERPRVYRSKSKSAQEAHEAIRPAGENFRTPDSLRGELNSDQFRLYQIIWKRTLASQMRDATGQRTTAALRGDGGVDGKAFFTATGKVISFPGFLKVYVEGSDDPGAESADQERVLPPLVEGDRVDAREFRPGAHTTQPPARYTEASLVKELESRGIGRPSTYASIIQTIQDRGYVHHKGQALVPTFTAFAVTRLLEESLPDLVDYDFTARMEDELDAIAEGRLDATSWLADFFFGSSSGNGGTTEFRRLGLKEAIAANAGIDPKEISRIELGTAPDGDVVSVRVGRYGPYLEKGDGALRTSIPDDLPPDELNLATALELLQNAEKGDEALGVDPDTGQPVYLRNGRFGWYVQLGDGNGGDKKSKPKMAGLWPDMDPSALDLETALMLLSFPRTLGEDPETGEPITAQDGRFGPYLKKGSETRSLPDHRALASITLEGALEAFKKPKGGRTRGTQTLKDLGTHPETGLDLVIKTGRFGPYITDGTVNASVPKGTDPESVTLDDAVALIAKREAKLRAQGKDPRAPKVRKSRRKKKS